MAQTTKPIKTPQDHLPKAVKAEADGSDPGTTTVDFHGAEYVVPVGYFDDMEVMESLEDGRIFAVLRGCFGADQWSAIKGQLREEHGGRIPASALDDVMSALMTTVGPTDKR